MSNTPNMSYCQWQNTRLALQQCMDDLNTKIAGDADDEWSRAEFEAATSCALIAQDLLVTIQEAAENHKELDDLESDDFNDILAEIDTDGTRNQQPETTEWPALSHGEPIDHPDYFDSWETPCGKALVKFDHDSEGCWDIYVDGKRRVTRHSRADAILAAIHQAKGDTDTPTIDKSIPIADIEA